ncbi:SIMPL domain-containing protein [Rhodovulum sulfidophilum]|uniref:SIMPL domain-containing protein n=1 Tax=Rhodovulum sulfidophilum TaxID=35806 RepID=UPI0019250D34|nr:SIMPL domain-containing protein [Rhodovulum sulfidophilum]MBL3575301.1 SIMPL domain-containing protein [Rhodovulum sulfidophilum]MCE8433122.1 SIMPL domain-containing protein [Rhodovulum sulfidophilum]MCF4115584.1 SIMPL domain-containing protein [Rhodovulum sulfidophilum]
MRLVPLAPLALAVSALVAPVAADAAPELRVTGTGSATAAPDMATLRLGVGHEADTAAEAMALVSDDLGRVMAELQAAGIEARDIQTSGLNLSPVWGNRSEGKRPRITGYSAANGVTVRVRELDGLGPLLDTVIGTGANTLDGLSFGLQEPGPVMDEARRAAVAEARRKAELFASASGQSLGSLVSLVEQGANQPRPMQMKMSFESMADTMPMAEGELELDATVTMVFELGDAE